MNSRVLRKHLFINFILIQTGRTLCFGGSRKEVQMKVIHFLIPFYHRVESLVTVSAKYGC